MKDLGRFRKKTRIQIHIIRNHTNWINIHGEIKEQNLERKTDRKEREFDGNHKIHLS